MSEVRGGKRDKRGRRKRKLLNFAQNSLKIVVLKKFNFPPLTERT